jgi:nucleoside-diphosphate-sugar epimerase
VLDTAADVGVDHVVLVSSALVYGASAENPIPLPEDAPLRPDPEVGWAVELAEAERRSADWADRSGKPLAILRPALIADPDGDDFLVRALGGIDSLRPAGESRPVQFVHIDDLAAAVTLAVSRRLDGTFNVAPDGWVDDSEAAALAGAVLPRPGLPARLVGPVRRLAWKVGLGATPPAMSAYADHPWVVAADRLRAEGWEPTHTNEEALVVTTKGSALAELSPRKRQELLLVGAGVLGVGVIVGAVLLIRRAIARRSASSS